MMGEGRAPSVDAALVKRREVLVRHGDGVAAAWAGAM
jgi:hypothetical protein